MQQEIFDTTLGGKTFSVIFTDLAERANGSLLARLGDTLILLTAVMGERERKDVQYLPLSVEFEERFYAAGEILGSRFARREGRPSDEAILSGRVIDRTIRPLFEPSLRRDIQVVATVLALGGDDPDVLAINAASIGLSVSNIPWSGPVSAVRVGKKKGSDAFVINPDYDFRAADDLELDLLLCGKDGTVTMIEVGAWEVPEDTLDRAISAGLQEIEKLQDFQTTLAKARGREKTPIAKPEASPVVAEVFGECAGQFADAVFSGSAGSERITTLKSEYLRKVLEVDPSLAESAERFFEGQVEHLMRERAIEKGERVDGRRPEEIRSLFAQAGGLSPMLHGSGVFYRGGTHVFSALTLGGPEDSLIIDSMERSDEKKRFMHHYNFPPFSVGETGRFGGMNRRMVGHGALAEKALLPVIPREDAFPYTIRLVSEAFSSNGSTSMGSVCAGTLALMDGGVPITRPVAGIAMGVMYDGPERYRILTDIQGPEDHHGDMDFKVAGTTEGVTAIQLDVKVEGVPPTVLKEALKEAKRARLAILKVMEEVISAPRASVSARAPQIVSLSVPLDMIGLVIGSSGKTIRKIEEESGTESVSIDDDGRVFIVGRGDAPEKAARIIRDMTRVFRAGDLVEGEVTRVMEFGAFVRLSPFKEGLVHVSEFAPFRIKSATDAVAVGERVRAEVKSVDDEGRVNLSIKAADPDFARRKGLLPTENHGRRNDSSES